MTYTHIWGTDLDEAELVVATSGTWVGASTFSNFSTISTALAAEEAAVASSTSSIPSSLTSASWLSRTSTGSQNYVSAGGSGSLGNWGRAIPYIDWSSPWITPFQPQLKNPTTKETPALNNNSWRDMVINYR